MVTLKPLVTSTYHPEDECGKSRDGVRLVGSQLEIGFPLHLASRGSSVSNDALSERERREDIVSISV